MQQQYWVTKKSVLRKLGGKEDDCVVSSDAELDAKLELFRSISDSCVQLQRVIDIYQERLCYLAQEENALGRYLKECGKNEKNQSAAQIMETAGKALAYTGRQRLNIRPPLVRLHHEVETFRGRAVSDTRDTVSDMEKVRTEYRAALSWMKSASPKLDPDTGRGLESFRKAQTCVRASKTNFDRLMLACLQKVDLLAAARCNMFSHALVGYQKTLVDFSGEASKVLNIAVGKIDKGTVPYDFMTVPELAGSLDGGDKDKNTFFNADYSDAEPVKPVEDKEKEDDSSTNLLGEDFTSSNQITESDPENNVLTSELLDLTWPSSSDFISGGFMPSMLLEEGKSNFSDTKLADLSEDKRETTEEQAKPAVTKDNSKKGTQVSWLSLFAELDPLSNQNEHVLNGVGDRA